MPRRMRSRVGRRRALRGARRTRPSLSRPPRQHVRQRGACRAWPYPATCSAKTAPSSLSFGARAPSAACFRSLSSIKNRRRPAPGPRTAFTHPSLPMPTLVRMARNPSTAREEEEGSGGGRTLASNRGAAAAALAGAAASPVQVGSRPFSWARSSAVSGVRWRVRLPGGGRVAMAVSARGSGRLARGRRE